MCTTNKFTAAAPGKAILFGEHAVVYGQPAIAVPVHQVQAHATILPHSCNERRGLTIEAVNLTRTDNLLDMPRDDPLAAIIWDSLKAFGIPEPPEAHIIIDSTIPIASGLGSSAAILTAIVRALSRYLGYSTDPAMVADIVNGVERLVHGQMSGIDGVVVAYAQSVYFARQTSLEILSIAKPFLLAIGDSGIQSSTRVAVNRVRRKYTRCPQKYAKLFSEIGDIVRAVRTSIVQGRPNELPALMDRNHKLLQLLGVSNDHLDHLIESARTAGAMAAKLCGAGLGGNIVALVDPDTKNQVRDALLIAGAKRVIITQVDATHRKTKEHPACFSPGSC